MIRLQYSKINNIERSSVLFVVGSILAGTLIAILPANLSSGLIVAVMISIGALLNIEIAAFSVLIIAFGLIPFVALDFRVATEIAISWSIFIWLLQSYGNKRVNLESISAYKNALWAFFLIWAAAFVQGYFVHKYQWASQDARRYIGLLTLLIFAGTESKRPGSVHRLILISGVLASLLLLLQLGTGWRVFAGAKGFMEDGIGTEFKGLARGSAEGGNYLMVYLMFFLLGRSAQSSGHRTWIHRFGALLALGGLVATYSRGIWLGLVVAMMVFPFIDRSGAIRGIKSLLLFFSTGALAIALLYPMAPMPIEAAGARILSIGAEGGKGTSLGARLDENNQAKDSIIENPIFGLGHGGEYKKTALQVSRGFVNEVTFVHNGYLWLLVKFGIIGLVVVLALLYRYLKTAIALTRAPTEREQHIGVATISAGIVLVINSMSSPVWAQTSDLVAFSALLVVAGASKLKNGGLS